MRIALLAAVLLAGCAGSKAGPAQTGAIPARSALQKQALREAVGAASPRSDALRQLTGWTWEDRDNVSRGPDLKEPDLQLRQLPCKWQWRGCADRRFYEKPIRWLRGPAVDAPPHIRPAAPRK